MARYYTLLPRCSTKCPLCSARLPRCRDELGRLRYSYSALNDIALGPNVRTVLLREIAPAHVSLRQRHIDVQDSFAERACRLTSGERPCVLTLVCPPCETCATGCLFYSNRIVRHHLSAGRPRRVDRPRQRRGRAVPFIKFLRIFSFISKDLFFCI